MVDILATAASWRMWVCDQSPQQSGALEMLQCEHSKSLDAVHSAVPSAQNTFKQEPPQEDSDSNEEEVPDDMASFGFKPAGLPKAAAKMQHMPGIHAEAVSAVPWAASAGKPGYFLKQTRKAVLRLLQSATEAGPGLILVAGDQVPSNPWKLSCVCPSLSCSASNDYYEYHVFHKLAFADTSIDSSSSPQFSAARMADRDEVIDHSVPDDTPLAPVSRWNDARPVSQELLEPLTQGVMGREHDAGSADPFEAVERTGVQFCRLIISTVL
jgi:hypothetical protein